MFNAIKSIFTGNPLEAFKERVLEINALEPEIRKLSNGELNVESGKLKERIKAGEFLEEVLPRAFALVREAARRTLNQRPYDVQLLGGLALHKGAVAEMSTGEGKTLAAVAPAYLNALAGKGVHVVTVNEYLARRDVVWMGQVYRALGLSVSCLVPNQAFIYDPDWKIPDGAEKLIDKERDTTGAFLVQQEFLKPVSRREAYQADITYGTNHEFGFDYLRDNLAYRLEERAQRDYNFAIIDEVDSILIDESRTPLIIAAPDSESSGFYKAFARVVKNLNKDEDYTVDEKLRIANITEKGIEKVEKVVGINNLYAPEHLRLVHFLEESLKAKALFQRDKDYVVKNNEVIIVDEFTGRMLHGRRYQGGLHQAIEAKEGVLVKEESKTYAKVSIQNYFRLYKKISGMTGTAQTSAEEFHKVYKLEVITVPTNKPVVRKDNEDAIYKTAAARWRAVVAEVKERHAAGQPVLLGTTSIEKNELISGMLTKAGVPHELLNAKNNEREGSIIAQAGKLGGVTVATNMAGRGVDIILGGNPPSPEAAEKVREAGGLHVIGTERHEARRIDNQLRGRSGRQGDSGSSRFFLSAEDDLLRIFGGDRLKNIMERFNLPEDQPLEVGMMSKIVAQAQAKVEGANFDMRKHLLEYDDVLNKQRTAVYARRFEILTALNKENLSKIVFESSERHFNILASQLDVEGGELSEEKFAELKKTFTDAALADKNFQFSISNFQEEGEKILEEKSEKAAEDVQTIGRLLSILDMLWMNHLEELEALSGSVGLRAYGQKDPLVEYRNEAHQIFKDFWGNFDAWIFMNLFKMMAQAQGGQAVPIKPAIKISPSGVSSDKVGRNDPCPCGSGKKYKKCHGR